MKSGMGGRARSTISFADRFVLQAHVMGKDMYQSALLRGNVRREYVDFASWIVLKYRKLRVEFEGSRVIQVDVAYKSVNDIIE